MKKNAAYTSPYEFTGLILLRQAIGLSLIGVGATPLPAAAESRTSLSTVAVSPRLAFGTRSRHPLAFCAPQLCIQRALHHLLLSVPEHLLYRGTFREK